MIARALYLALVVTALEAGATSPDCTTILIALDGNAAETLSLTDLPADVVGRLRTGVYRTGAAGVENGFPAEVRVEIGIVGDRTTVRVRVSDPTVTPDILTMLLAPLENVRLFNPTPGGAWGHNMVGEVGENGGSLQLLRRLTGESSDLIEPARLGAVYRHVPSAAAPAVVPATVPVPASPPPPVVAARPAPLRQFVGYFELQGEGPPDAPRRLTVHELNGEYVAEIPQAWTENGTSPVRIVGRSLDELHIVPLLRDASGKLTPAEGFDGLRYTLQSDRPEVDAPTSPHFSNEWRPPSMADLIARQLAGVCDTTCAVQIRERLVALNRLRPLSPSVLQFLRDAVHPQQRVEVRNEIIRTLVELGLAGEGATAEQHRLLANAIFQSIRHNSVPAYVANGLPAVLRTSPVRDLLLEDIVNGSTHRSWNERDNFSRVCQVTEAILGPAGRSDVPPSDAFWQGLARLMRDNRGNRENMIRFFAMLGRIGPLGGPLQRELLLCFGSGHPWFPTASTYPRPDVHSDAGWTQRESDYGYLREESLREPLHAALTGALPRVDASAEPEVYALLTDTRSTYTVRRYQRYSRGSWRQYEDEQDTVLVGPHRVGALLAQRLPHLSLRVQLRLAAMLTRPDLGGTEALAALQHHRVRHPSVLEAMLRHSAGTTLERGTTTYVLDTGLPLPPE